MTVWQAWKNRVLASAVVGFACMQTAMAVPTLSIVATPDPAVVGSPLALDVAITGVTDLYAFQYSLSFDPTLFQVSSVTEGAFLATGGSTFFDGGSVNNMLGTVSFTFNTLIGAIPGTSGNGTLARINLNVIGTGAGALNFSDVLFLDSQSGDIQLVVNNRILTAVPEPGSLALMGLGIAGLSLLRRRMVA